VSRGIHLAAAVLAVALCAGCASVAREAGGPAVIFVLDSPVHAGFVEGRVIGLGAAEVSHGSLVGRVLRSYCRASLLPIVVEELEGGVSRSAYLEGLRAVARYVAAHPGARVVVNVSLASERTDEAEAALLRRLRQAGVLVVAAAGNEASDRLTYPAAYPGVVAVAAAEPSGKAPSSNFGPHVDIAASGDISFLDYEFLPYEWLRRQTEAHGTSFAAPRVAATVAYLLEADPSLTPLEAYRVLERTARPIGGPHFRDGLLGAGLLDVHRAKASVRPSYRFVHFVLPVSIWILLGVLSCYLCLRYSAVGLFLTLLIWLLALPASILLIIKLGDYLEFVGGGSMVSVRGLSRSQPPWRWRLRMADGRRRRRGHAGDSGGRRARAAHPTHGQVAEVPLRGPGGDPTAGAAPPLRP
jgi:hypothetical protein